MEKMPCSPYIMHRRYSVELCTDGVQSSHFTKVDCYDIFPSLTVGKIKMATNPVNMGSVAVFYFVTICAIL